MRPANTVGALVNSRESSWWRMSVRRTIHLALALGVLLFPLRVGAQTIAGWGPLKFGMTTDDLQALYPGKCTIPPGPALNYCPLSGTAKLGGVEGRLGVYFD